MAAAAAAAATAAAAAAAAASLKSHGGRPAVYKLTLLDKSPPGCLPFPSPPPTDNLWQAFFFWVIKFDKGLRALIKYHGKSYMPDFMRIPPGSFNLYRLFSPSPMAHAHTSWAPSWGGGGGERERLFWVVWAFFFFMDGGSRITGGFVSANVTQ